MWRHLFVRNVAVLSVEDGLGLTVCDFYEWGGEIVLTAPPPSFQFLTDRVSLHWEKQGAVEGGWGRGRGKRVAPLHINAVLVLFDVQVNCINSLNWVLAMIRLPLPMENFYYSLSDLEMFLLNIIFISIQIIVYDERLFLIWYLRYLAGFLFNQGYPTIHFFICWWIILFHSSVMIVWWVVA